MVSSKDYRRVIGKFATGVVVISSLDADGHIRGMTANAVTSVSLEPPLILVCIGHERNTFRNVRERCRFGINILNDQQGAIARYYARDYKDRVGDLQVPWQRNEGGSPRLEESLAFLECRLVAHYDISDHAIFVGEVEEAVARAGQPLLFYEGQLAS